MGPGGSLQSSSWKNHALSRARRAAAAQCASTSRLKAYCNNVGEQIIQSPVEFRKRCKSRRILYPPYNTAPIGNWCKLTAKLLKMRSPIKSWWRPPPRFRSLERTQSNPVPCQTMNAYQRLPHLRSKPLKYLVSVT